MKNFKLSLAYLAVFSMIFASCSKEENAMDTDENSVVLTFGAVLNDLANRASKQSQFDQIPTCSDEDPSYAVIGLTVDGEEWEDVTVDILQDSNGYFTAYTDDLKISVPDGNGVDVVITSFMVYADGVELPIWVAPTGGGFAGYVDNPLPLDFTLQRGTKPYIDIEVLCFDRRNVNEYGYPFFDLVPTVVYPLCFFANYCPTPDGRHYVGNYSLDLWYDDGETRIQIYNDETPVVGTAGGEFQARPVCVVVPGAPDGFGADENYLFYVITPLDWTGSYGDIANVPMAEVGLSWNDVNGLLNTDGETNEYLHLFIGCDEGPGGDDDSDDDGHNDDVDNCPNVFNPGQEDTDGDGKGDACDNCDDRDSDGDGFVNCEDECPDEYNETNNGCPETTPATGCGTAFMFGDTPINTISNSNRWGWAENFNTNDGASQTFNFYRGAGQNDTEKGVLAGTVTITASGNQVEFDINLETGFSISDLHVYLGEDSPGDMAKSPGQYNRNDEVGDSATNFTLTRTSSDSSFWVIVHAGETCN